MLCLLGAASAQEDHDTIDLLGEPWHASRWQVTAYNPRVEPQVRCLRSRDEAVRFVAAAWGEANASNEALQQIDFEHEQVLVVAWGALRWAERSAGWGIRLHLERATIRDGVLRVTVRTVLPPGPGIDIALDAAEPGRTSYPSLFVRTPRADRVQVELCGARRRNPATDFRAVVTEDLAVSVGPDACPARERMTLVPPREVAAADTPMAGLFSRDGQSAFEVGWGELGAGAYGLELTGMVLDGDVARLTLRADNRRIFVYSGSGVHRPALAVALPPVAKVHLHIERVGLALPATEPDFVAGTGERVVLTVDRSAVRDR